MYDTDLVKEIEDEVIKEFQIIKRTPFIEKTIGLLEIVRAIDDIFYFYSYALPGDDPNNEYWYKYFKQHHNGFYECLEQISYEEDKIENSNLFYNSNPGSKHWANHTLLHCGNLGYTSRFLQLVKQGIFSLEKKESNRLLFKCRIRQSGAEWLETQLQKGLLGKKVLVGLKIPRIKELEAAIEQEFAQKVFLWNTHFIQYDTSPIIDEFFDLQAEAFSKGFVGHDSFTGDSKFNGINYNVIQKVLKWLVASSSKHVSFCAHALNKYGNTKINQWNFLTTPYNIVQLVQTINRDTGIPVDRVKWIVGILTLRKDNLHIHLGAPGSSLPLLIQIEKNWVLRSVAGCLANPFTYLIRCLKFYCKDDYSKNVNLREDYFKEEFYSIFNNGSIITCGKQVELRKDKKILTDIDAMLFDTNNRTLLIVQLKWMDDFGTSMAQRYSMAKNMYESSVKWIDKTDQWLRENDPTNLLHHFNIDHKDKKVEKVEKLILGRFFAHFSDKQIDKRALWCGWPQFVHLTRQKKVRSSIDALIKEIQKEAISKVILKTKVPEENFKLGKYLVTVIVK